MKNGKMSARFWTRKQCNQTKKQCIEAGFKLDTSTEGMTKIYDENHLVVSWLLGAVGAPNLVRVDLSYFN